MRTRACLAAAVATVLVNWMGGCAGPAPKPAPPSSPAEAEPMRPGAVAPASPGPGAPAGAAAPAVSGAGARDVLPGVRLDLAARTVEFDGIVPIDAHDPDAPNVYLELMVCTADTREHESLVVTRVRAAHVHAALLMLGLSPGSPGNFEPADAGPRVTPPTGPSVAVMVRWRLPDGSERTGDLHEWVVSARDGRRFGTPTPEQAGVRLPGGFCFAGSRTVRRADPGTGRMADTYEADGGGTLVGLCTFGSETIAWRQVISPDAGAQEPEWIADRRIVPKVGTAVTVVLRPLDRN
ncbi:MAG: hypothetical protein JNJ48_07260 [Phycisphaerae bacterium]|nr:hypothetical protein [Phycisphaerae bacterium]